MDYDKNIDTLLDLDGVVIEQVGRYWTKFEVRRIPKITEEIPHGIRYSLTLHDRHGERIMGFDNAHAIKSRKKGTHLGRKTYDHCHRHSKDEGTPYELLMRINYLKTFGQRLIKHFVHLG